MTLPMDRTTGNTMGRNAIAVPPIARLAEGRVIAGMGEGSENRCSGRGPFDSWTITVLKNGIL